MRYLPFSFAVFSLLAGCTLSSKGVKSAAVGVRCGDLDVTVVSATHSTVMVELELRGRAKSVGAPGQACRVTIERAELAMSGSLLAALRGSPDSAKPIAATLDEVAVLEVEPGETDTALVSFELSEAEAVAAIRAEIELLDDDDEVLVVLDTEGPDEPIVETVEVPLPTDKTD